MKKIISLTANGAVHQLDALVEGVVVVDISYKMLGVTGLNRGAAEEAHYLVTLVEQLNDKQAVVRLIPASRMDELMFIEIKEEKEKESCETTKKMQKAEE